MSHAVRAQPKPTSAAVPKQTTRASAHPQPEQGVLPLDEPLAADERDDVWLEGRVKLLWSMHFRDAARGYPIETCFSNRAKHRFGSICARNGKTVIAVNRLFADPDVPEYVVDATLAHELAHYVHGFGSGLPRQHRHPHRGGVVDLELERRGLGELDRRADRWRKTCWDALYEAKCGDIVARQRERTDGVDDAWNSVLGAPRSRSAADLCARVEMLAPHLGYVGAVPFRVEWLRASRRQQGLSYWFSRSRIVRLHGLLALPNAPGAVIDFEIAYWLARRSVGKSWPVIVAAVDAAGMRATVEEALRWRRSAWTSFRRRHHPLDAKGGQ